LKRSGPGFWPPLIARGIVNPRAESLSADKIHLPPRPGPPPALRSRRAKLFLCRSRNPCQFTSTSRHGPCRIATCLAGRSIPPATTGPMPTPRSGKRCGKNATLDARGFLGVSNVSLAALANKWTQTNSEMPGLRAEPLLRAPWLGPRCALVLSPKKNHLSGIFASHCDVEVGGCCVIRL